MEAKSGRIKTAKPGKPGEFDTFLPVTSSDAVFTDEDGQKSLTVSLEELIEATQHLKADGTMALYPKGADRTKVSPFNFAVIGGTRQGIPVTEVWILVNAWYDYTVERFKRVDLDNFSFGWQFQGGGTYPGEEHIDPINQGANLWKANGRKAFAESDPMRDLIQEEIGMESGGTWAEYGIVPGWLNVFMCDSYGGMTIGGAGFEIDGNGIYPYKRVSMSKFGGGSTEADRNPEEYGFAYNGNLWNAYHNMTDRDTQDTSAFFWGMKSPIDYDYTGENNPYSNRAKLTDTTFTWSVLPPNVDSKVENWKDILSISESGEGVMGDRTMTTTVTIDTPVIDGSSFNMAYPDETWNKNNTLIIAVKGEKEDGSLKQMSVNATLTDFGIFGYAGDAFVTMKIVLAKH